MTLSAIPLLRRPSVWIGVLFTVVSLVALGSAINIPQAFATLGHADGRLVALSVLLAALTSFMRALRWQTVLRAKTPFWAIFHAENVGYLINNVLPLRMGEPARAVMLSRSAPIRPVEALSTVVVTHLADIVAILVMLGLVIPSLGVSESVRIGGYGTLLLAVLLTVFIAAGALAHVQLLHVVDVVTGRLLPRSIAHQLTDWTADFLNGLQPLREGRRLAALAASTALLWLLYALYYHVILLAFVPNAPIAWSVLATCTASLSTAVPSSPAYVGVYDAVIAFTMTPYIAQDAALGYAIILHTVEFVVVLLFGLFSLVASGVSLGRIAQVAATLNETSSVTTQGIIQ